MQGASSSHSAPPLSQLKVVEFAGIGPGPMVGMILADFGAQVIRVDRPSLYTPDVFARGKRCVTLDAKVPSAREALCKLIEDADILIDPSRPGKMEQVGLGPDVFLGNPDTGLLGRNPRLIYARLAGFPRTGPHSDMAGHDLSYLALSGVLSLFPGEHKPSFPLNIVSSFAGGSLVCALGILIALHERARSGRGQVVHSDMVSGTRYLASFAVLHRLHPALAPELLSRPRGHNMLDGGAPYYDTYRCADARCVAVACVEDPFWRTFLPRFLAAVPHLALDGWRPDLASRERRADWPRLRTFLERGFALRDRDFWARLFHGTDACTFPVLSVTEAAAALPDGAPAPATLPDPPHTAVPPPHPQLSRTPALALDPAEDVAGFMLRGQHTDEVLRELGLSDAERAALERDGALGKRRAKL